MERQLVYSAIQTPDGTILESKYGHDYVTYTDKNGKEYMLDGGNDYQRYIVHDDAPFKNISLYMDDDFELIRQKVKRGGRGINGDEPLTFVPICEMNDGWLVASIKYNEDRGLGNSLHNKLYKMEIEYRKQNNITIL